MRVNSASRHDYLPAWLQWSVAGVLAIIFVLLPFHAFLSTWGGTAIGPLELWKSWKEILLLVAAAPLAVWLTVRPSRWRQLLIDPLAWWVLGFVVVLGSLGVLYIGENGSQATLAGIAITGRYFAIFALGYVLVRCGRWEWTMVRRELAGYLIVAGTAMALLGIVQIHALPNNFLSQFGYDKETTIAPYTLIDENPAAPRAFATLRGPNDFAAYLIAPLLLAIMATRRSKWWGLATLAIAAGIYESASRSAWVGTIIAVTVLLALLYGKTMLHSRRWQLTGVAGIVLAVGIFFTALSIPSVRLEVFHSSPGDTSLTEGSTDQHWAATSAGIGRVVGDPDGCGPGCAGPASYYGDRPRISENYYVQIAEETGVAGLILWVGVAVMLVRRLWSVRTDYMAAVLLASFAGISTIGLWLHVWADDPLSLTWWLLSGVTLGYYSPKVYDKQKLNNKHPDHDRQKQKETTQVRH